MKYFNTMKQIPPNLKIFSQIFHPTSVIFPLKIKIFHCQDSETLSEKLTDIYLFQH